MSFPIYYHILGKKNHKILLSISTSEEPEKEPRIVFRWNFFFFLNRDMLNVKWLFVLFLPPLIISHIPKVSELVVQNF